MRVPKASQRPKAKPGEPPLPEQRTSSTKELRHAAARAAVPLSQKAHELAAATGGEVVTKQDHYEGAPGVRIKSPERIAEKRIFELGGYAEFICDIAAISIRYPTLHALRAGGLAALQNTFGAENIVRYRDRFDGGSDYADVSANVLIDGHIVEVQLHVAPMLFAKQVEQVLYNERRRILHGVIPDQNYRLAWLEGAATAIFGVARLAVDGGRDLNERERDFILSYLDR